MRRYIATRHQRQLLAAGMLAPLFGALVLLAAIAAYPGFDHASQYISELGGPGAPYPLIFNLGVTMTGVLAILGGIGLYCALSAVSGRVVPAVLVALLFIVAGAGLIVSSIYVVPDPRHRWAVNLGLAVQICPLLLFWSLWGVKGLGRLKAFLILLLLAMGLMTLLTWHVLLPGLITDANVGWWERGLTAVLAGWVGVLALALDQALGRKGYWSQISPIPTIPAKAGTQAESTSRLKQ